MNTDNPLEVVLNRLGWRDPAKAVYFHWDEVRHWQEGALDALLASGIVKPAEPLTTVSCNSCDEDCHAVEVQTFPAQNGQPARPVIRCAMGIVKVDIRRLAQWKSSIAYSSQFIAQSLNIRHKGQNTDTGLWEVGMMQGEKSFQMLGLQQIKNELNLTIGDAKIPLIELIYYQDGKYALNAAMIRQYVDNAKPADPRYTPSNLKREISKSNTQAMYAEWQKKYRDLFIKHKSKKSDTWYSQQIAKLAIAQGRSADTIKKHMKS